MQRSLQLNVYTIALGLVFLFAASLQQCPARREIHDHDEHAGEEQGHAHADIVRLTPAEMEELGIRTAIAAPGKLSRLLELNGEIVINPERLAHIVPRFPGIVKAIHPKIGDNIRTGDVLAEIEGNESLAAYQVRSPMDGMLIEKNLTLGETVGDGEHAFVIADLSEVWINLSIYQKDRPYLKTGQKVRLQADQYSSCGEGKIDYISPIIDESTRTATARVVLPNPDGRLCPGAFVRATVSTDIIAVNIAVPQNAVIQFEDRPVVFVLDEDGFEPRPVSPGAQDDDSVEIRDGLEPGQVYATEGAFTLKAELQKASFGGHVH